MSMNPSMTNIDGANSYQPVQSSAVYWSALYRRHLPFAYANFKNERRSPVCLKLIFGGPARIRTGVHGFAVRCVTTPPQGQLKIQVRWVLPTQNSITECVGYDLFSPFRPINDSKMPANMILQVFKIYHQNRPFQKTVY